MDLKKLSLILPIASVAVMFLWGALVPGGWGKSWIAVVVGGVLAGILRAMGTEEDKKKSGGKARGAGRGRKQSGITRCPAESGRTGKPDVRPIVCTSGSFSCILVTTDRSYD